MENELEISQCKTALHDELDRMSHLISKVERLNETCEDNMKRLNAMMLELKGIITMVRPMAKKNDWYGEEVLHREDTIKNGFVLKANYPSLEKMN